MIKLLRRHEVDEKKWDECINQSEFPSIFAKCWYLDIFTRLQWQCLIYGDYEAVLPLFKKRKWFIPYVTQPFLCQQGGVFSKAKKGFDADMLYCIAVKDIFNLNILTRVAWSGHVTAKERVNHILELKVGYDKIRSGYNRNTIRNLTKARNTGIIIENEFNPDLVATFLANNDQSGYIIPYQNNIIELIQKSFNVQSGFVLKASIDGKMNSLAYFIEDGDRLYFLLCASDVIGKNHKSLYLLIDEAIKMYAEKKMILDFTGSNIENIARRNLGFGAKTETYFQLKWNKYHQFIKY